MNLKECKIIKQQTGVETGNQQITVISIANVFTTTVFHTLQCERDNIRTQITLCVNKYAREQTVDIIRDCFVMNYFQ